MKRIFFSQRITFFSKFLLEIFKQELLEFIYFHRWIHSDEIWLLGLKHSDFLKQAIRYGWNFEIFPVGAPTSKLRTKRVWVYMQQPTIISEIMESLRLYCVHLSLLAIENNGAVTVNDQSSRNQPKNSDDKKEDNRRNHILLKISNIEIRILINYNN